MFKSDDLLEQLQEAGIPYELNASKPGIYIGGVFYKYGDAPTPSSILDEVKADIVPAYLEPYTSGYSQEKDYELQRIVKDTTEPYNK